MKIFLIIFIGVLIDILVFYSLCRSASEADKAIEEAWKKSELEDWEGEV